MLTKQFPIPTHHALAIDLFAGGASTGMEQALGRPAGWTFQALLKLRSGLGLNELLGGTRDDMENEMTDEPKLWAMHVPGPDDVFAMASEEAAHSAVAEHNKAVAEMWLAERFGMTPEQVSACVIEWPHSAESHAESLASGEADVLDTTNGMGIHDSLFTALKGISDG